MRLIARRLLPVACSLLLAGAAGCRDDEADAGDLGPPDLAVELCPIAVTFPSKDGLLLHGTFSPPCGRPTVVLAHQRCSDRAEWSNPDHDWVGAFATAGIATLAFDLRGHGASTTFADGSEHDLCSESASALFAGMPDDVAAAVDFARAKLGAPKVAVLGASIGANSALLAYGSDGALTLAAALSPGIDYQGLEPEEAVKAAGSRPLVLEAADDDPAAAQAVRQFAADNPAALTTVWPEGGHGNALITAHPDELARVVGLTAASFQ